MNSCHCCGRVGEWMNDWMNEWMNECTFEIPFYHRTCILISSIEHTKQSFYNLTHNHKHQLQPRNATKYISSLRTTHINLNNVSLSLSYTPLNQTLQPLKKKKRSNKNKKTTHTHTHLNLFLHTKHHSHSLQNENDIHRNNCYGRGTNVLFMTNMHKGTKIYINICCL
jgi:hypothetical protein